MLSEEFEPAKFLVLLLVKNCLDGSIGHGIFRWRILDVKWSMDSLLCKVTVLIIDVFLEYLVSICLSSFMMSFKRNLLKVSKYNILL